MPQRRVDAVAYFPHYEDHLRPIWDRLPEHMKGTFHPVGRMATDPNRVCLVAGWVDARTVGQHMPIIYVEHGAGQTYQGDPNPNIAHHPSYSNAHPELFENALGFISPSQEVADRWTQAPAAAVGCPKLDRYRGIEPSNPRSVCFTFHFPGTMCPENGTAYYDYEPLLPDIVAKLQSEGITVFGHAHPRWDGQLWAPMEKAGMTLLHTDREVFEQAAMLVADNTSLIPEMASLGRPVLLLDADHYRKDVEHGGRFWRWPAIVPQIHRGYKHDVARVARTLLDVLPHYSADASAALAKEVYAFNDRHASERAAAFVVDRILEM